MFKGRVEKVSHEGGLLVSYTGAYPALGSVMVDSGENYIGKVDGVIGNLKNSLVHIAHLDRQANPSNMVGLEITIRTKGQETIIAPETITEAVMTAEEGMTVEAVTKEETEIEIAQIIEAGNRRGRDDRGRNDRNSGRGRDDRRGKDDRRGRNDRNSGRDTHSHNDWTCGECGNVNYSFRTECNRCGAPKGRGRAQASNGQVMNAEQVTEERNHNLERGIGNVLSVENPILPSGMSALGVDVLRELVDPNKGHHRKLKDPPPLHPTKYGRSKRRDR